MAIIIAIGNLISSYNTNSGSSSSSSNNNNNLPAVPEDALQLSHVRVPHGGLRAERCGPLSNFIVFSKRGAKHPSNLVRFISLGLVCPLPRPPISNQP